MDLIIEPEPVEAIALKCVECGQEFSICRPCWRGQRYCGEFCSRSARLKQRRNIQRRYSQTAKGLESGRVRQQRRYKKIKSLKRSH